MENRSNQGQAKTRAPGEGIHFFSHTLSRYLRPADCYDMDDKELGILWAECKATASRDDDKIKIGRVRSAKTFEQLCELILEGKVES
jgi:hypothetical protein